MATTRLTSRRRQDPGSKWVRIAMAVLATVGLIDTGSITLKRWGLLGQLTCPVGGDGCDKVLSSAWGTLFQGGWVQHSALIRGGAGLPRGAGDGHRAPAPWAG